MQKQEQYWEQLNGGPKLKRSEEQYMKYQLLGCDTIGKMSAYDNDRGHEIYLNSVSLLRGNHIMPNFY